MISQRIREILFFFRSNLWPLLAVTLPFALAGALLVHAFGEPMAIENETAGDVHWQSVFGLLVLYPLALGVKLLAIHAMANAAPLNAASLLGEALRLWPSLAAISLLGAMFAGSVAMLGLGVGIEVLRGAGLLGGPAAGLLVFFALPALYLYARIGTATVIAALEGLPALAALGAAWQRSQADQAVMFRVLLFILGSIVLAMLLLFSLISSAGEAFVKSFTGDLLARSLSDWVFCLVTVAFYRFWSLQPREESR